MVRGSSYLLLLLPPLAVSVSSAAVYYGQPFPLIVMPQHAYTMMLDLRLDHTYIRAPLLTREREKRGERKKEGRADSFSGSSVRI